MHVFHCFVCFATLQSNKCVGELTLGGEDIMRTELHLKEVKNLVEMLFCLIVVERLYILDLIVNHGVQIFFNDELFPDLNNLLEEGFCFGNRVCAFFLKKFTHVVITAA